MERFANHIISVANALDRLLTPVEKWGFRVFLGIEDGGYFFPNDEQKEERLKNEMYERELSQGEGIKSL